MGVMIASVNPATGETIRTFDAMSDAQVSSAIARADTAWRTYRHTLARRSGALAHRRRRYPGAG